MNTEPGPPIEPNPIEQAGRFKDLLAKLAQARSNFLDERAKGMDISEERANQAFQNFESDQIEIILSKILNSSSPWSKTSDSNADSEYFDATGDTFIDTERGEVVRGENTARSEDRQLDYSPLVDTSTIYTISPLGLIERQIETSVEETTDHATPHPVHGIINLPSGEVINKPEDTVDEPVELDGYQAKQFVDLLEKVIDGVIEVYHEPYWNIAVNTHNEGHFVIE
ncbi:hypothetical protein EXS66_01155 [Candidatus Saccharibacteria bacterium]|nr:hypothetical protein [Candidatus Saccharibacteria bacterium]